MDATTNHGTARSPEVSDTPSAYATANSAIAGKVARRTNPSSRSASGSPVSSSCRTASGTAIRSTTTNQTEITICVSRM